MAFSQVQCLDDSHVNWRSSESKPEFFYSEEQRLALEALVSRGPDAFYEVLKKENIRDFLSELELKRILDRLETYDPSAEYVPCGDAQVDRHSQAGDSGPVPSLEYWPERSDRSIPQLDLGWPDTVAYRGVTRATVYMQPPIDFQPHIKEVVRKIIVQAQRVVAVVMDMFTDVDIFKDLLDAGFKRKVAVYVIVDETNLKYFLQMCERAQMHTGHLKNLRVRTAGGTEFFTHSATKFKGALAQKFMFVDGDKAVCGSYSFTWSAARTDRNVISVLSGQVVEAFDKQFQELYLMSRSVSLKSIPMDEEPEPDPIILLPQAPVNPDSTAVKKMVNPKYALVKAKSAEQISRSSKTDSEKKPPPQPQAEAKSKAKPEGRVSERPSEALETAPPIHPGLLNLEKANMFDYLPTWVEPDPEPGSDILGYINIIDPKDKNVPLYQMNRIKVCDISRAKAQHKKLQKEKLRDARQSHGHQPAPGSPGQPEGPSPSDRTPEAPPEPPASPTEKASATTPQSEQQTLATLASNRHLKQPSDTHAHDQTDDPHTTPPVPKPRTVHVTDLITAKARHGENGAATAEDTPTEPEPGSDEAGAGPSEPPATGANTDEPCKLTRQAAVTQEDGAGPVNGVPGREGEEDEEEDYVMLSDHESCSGSSAHHSHLHSDASSISDEFFERDRAGFLRRTNSDFLLNGGGHGPAHPLHLPRKLSEPHMSRGTFVSPLGSPQLMALEEANQRRRRSDSMEETRCVLGKGRNPRALPDGYITCPSNAPQGPQLLWPGIRVQVSTGGGQSGTTQGKGLQQGKHQPDAARFKKLPPGPAGQPYWPGKAPGASKNSQPSHFSQGRGGPSRAIVVPMRPFPEGPLPAEEIRTPFGIPLSKLSQSKHLKSKAGQWSDSKKRHREAAHRKDQ